MNLCLAFFLGMGGEMNEIKIYKKRIKQTPTSDRFWTNVYFKGGNFTLKALLLRLISKCTLVLLHSVGGILGVIKMCCDFSFFWTSSSWLGCENAKTTTEARPDALHLQIKKH